jgi:hypothetical protein
MCPKKCSGGEGCCVGVKTVELFDYFKKVLYGTFLQRAITFSMQEDLAGAVPSQGNR